MSACEKLTELMLFFYKQKNIPPPTPKYLVLEIFSAKVLGTTPCFCTQKIRQKSAKITNIHQAKLDTA